MAIHTHLPDQTAFEPEAIQAMSRAFEEACASLRVFAGDQAGREIIATRIIELTRNSVIDPVTLRDRVLQEARTSV